MNSKSLKFNIILPFSRRVQSEAGAAGEEAPERKEPVGLTVCGRGCQPVAGHGENEEGIALVIVSVGLVVLSVCSFHFIHGKWQALGYVFSEKLRRQCFLMFMTLKKIMNKIKVRLYWSESRN